MGMGMSDERILPTGDLRVDVELAKIDRRLTRLERGQMSLDDIVRMRAAEILLKPLEK